MSPARPRRTPVVIAFALFVFLGFSAGVTGVAWPSMRADFSRPLADLGVLLAVGTGGYFLAGLASGRLTRRFGMGSLLVGVVLLGSLSLAGFGLVRSWLFLLACSFGVGFAGGTVDSVINAYVALRHDVRTLNLLHASFGIGATGGPVLVAAVLARSLPWTTAYFVLAGAELLLVVAVVRARRVWPPRETLMIAEGHHDRLAGPVLALLSMFFLYVGVEVTAGQWSYSVLTEGRGTGELAAGIWVALYWGGLTGGRLALGVAGDRVDPRASLRWSMIGSILGSALFWIDPAGLGVFALPLLGVSLAGVFPTLVVLTPRWVGEEKASTVIGYQIAASSAGHGLMPWLAGLVVDAAGIEALGFYLVCLVLAMSGFNWLIDATMRHDQAKAGDPQGS